MSLKELALLELEFLWRVEWRIVPRPEVLVDYYRSLVERSDGFAIVGERERRRKERERKSKGTEGSQGSGSSGVSEGSREMEVDRGSDKAKEQNGD